MKLFTLCDSAEHPCFVLTVNETAIMLDCAINLNSLMHFLPHTLVKSSRLSSLPQWLPDTITMPSDEEKDKLKQFKDCSLLPFFDANVEFEMPDFTLIGDIEILDAILISNYYSLLALPFITEYCNYDGRIYCTEPTLEFGGQYLMEIASYLEMCPKSKLDKRWTEKEMLKYLPPSLASSYKHGQWKGFYSKQEIQSCLRKVQRAEFNEKLDLFSLIRVTATCSGFALGSCNWIIETNFEKIVYLAFSSAVEFRSKAIELTPLLGADAMILAGLCRVHTGSPGSLIGDIGANLVHTLKEGGNVLFPCLSAGVLFDLLESVVHYLDEAGLSSIPIYYISPIADQALAFSNIFSEWASAERQNRVYLPEEPFVHGQLLKSRRLRQYSSISDIGLNDFKVPCIVFCGHASLRFGDSVHFMELWGKSSTNTLIIVESAFPYPEIIAPYQPLAMRVAYCPLDLRLTASKVQKLLLETWKPRHIICSDEYARPPISAPGRMDLVIKGNESSQLITYHPYDVIDIPIKSEFVKISAAPSLVEKLELHRIGEDTSVCRVVGEIHMKDNKIMMQSVRDENKSVAKNRNYLPYGDLDIKKFVTSLERQGFKNIRLSKTDTGHSVNLEDIDTFIEIEENNTHIFCEAAEPIRKKLYLTLMDCLSQLH